jgi:hypothetical protein
METMTARDAEARFRPAPLAPPRRAFGATLVAALYVLLVLGAPLIIRYGPEQIVPPVTAAPVPVAHRCATAPEFGLACPSAVSLASSRTPAAAVTR